MINKNKLKVLIFSLLALIVLFLILIIALPLMLKNKYSSDSQTKTTPHSDNTDLWAKFPGDLKTSLSHKFNLLGYESNQSFTGSVGVKDSFSLIEEVSYDNFNFTDKEDTIFYDAKNTFKLKENKEEKETKKINTLSMGLFETLETLTNPPLYQKGIDAIQYLLNKALVEPEIFIRQLFTYDAYSSIVSDDTRVKETLLKNIDPDKADKILSSDEQYKKYSFRSVNGFYQWIKILGLQNEINDATWLTELFELSPEEKNSILGKDQYLYKYFNSFNLRLAYKFDCEAKTTCGNELLFIQLMSGNVTDYVGIESISSLYSLVDPEFYPFSKSPELSIYFEEYKIKVHNQDIKYDNYTPSLNQLNLMIDTSSPNCLLSANNSALLLELNRTDDSYGAYEIYSVSTEVMHFLCDYFFDYLPNLFLYQEFIGTDSKTYKIDPLAKTYATITQGIVDRTYGKLVNSIGIYNLILSKVVWDKLNEFSGLTSNSEESDEICPLIMQQALDDGKKALIICSDPVIGFNSLLTIYKWFDPYPCIKSGDESKCNMAVIDYLKTLVFITDDEIKSIYNENFFGRAIEEGKAILKEACGCEDDCDNKYLAKQQFWTSKITKSLPSPYTSNTISTLLPDYFPYPIELSYFQEKEGQTEPISEENIDYLISLASADGNLLSKDSSSALIKKTELEKELTIYLNEKSQYKNEDIMKAIDFLNNGYLFDNILYTEYKNKNNLLQGSSEEDKRFLNFLSSGNFFENYKPGINKTTGFNFGINLESGEKVETVFNREGIYGKQTDTSHYLRRIINMNSFSVLNIKKEEYNYLENKFTYIDSPIFDFHSLLGKYEFTDGFQYEHDSDEIYYYNSLSSRPFKFVYSNEEDYQDQITCRKYILDTDDLSLNINEEMDKGSKKAMLTQKMNKPFMISVGNNDLSVKIKEYNPDSNYICVDVMSNMVLESEINFVFSIYTRKYGFIYKKIENDKVCPIFTYQRNYKVDIDSYNNNFPGVSDFYYYRVVFIIVCLVLIVILFIIILVAASKIHKQINEQEINDNLPEEKILPSTREPTTHY